MTDGIKMTSRIPEKKIHVSDLLKIDSVRLDMFGKFEMEKREIGSGFHILEINTSHFRDRIVELVEKNNTKERIEEIISNWDVPSYNNLDDITRQYHHYSLFTDNEGYIERITMMSERVCGVCLDFVLEMVYQSK
jgi:hypothetical protein